MSRCSPLASCAAGNRLRPLRPGRSGLRTALLCFAGGLFVFSRLLAADALEFVRAFSELSAHGITHADDRVVIGPGTDHRVVALAFASAFGVCEQRVSVSQIVKIMRNNQRESRQSVLFNPWLAAKDCDLAIEPPPSANEASSIGAVDCLRSAKRSFTTTSLLAFRPVYGENLETLLTLLF